MTRHVRIMFLVVTALAVALTSGCSRQEVEAEPVLRPVRSEQVFATGGGRQRMFSGAARSGTESRLSFRVSGKILAINVKLGDKVTPGQIIAELDPEDYRLQVQDSEASLQQAQAQARNAALNYQRVQDLYENRNASKSDLDAARASQESADASVESIENRLELAKRQLGYTKLRAPTAGSIASKDVEVDENVMAGQAVVLLTSESELEIPVAVPSVVISQVREGDPVSVVFDAVRGRTLQATVTEVGVASTGTATTFPVVVTLDESDPNIRSGMSAEVTFQFGREGDATRYIVPLMSVLEDQNGRFVYVVEASGEAGVGLIKRVPVTIGDIVDEGVEVREGLEDGEHVVTAGVSRITDGQRVRFGAGGAE